MGGIVPRELKLFRLRMVIHKDNKLVVHCFSQGWIIVDLINKAVQKVIVMYEPTATNRISATSEKKCLLNSC